MALVAVFFTFAPIGFLLQLVSTTPGNWVQGLAAFLISGAISTAWAAAFIRRRFWWLAIIIPLQSVGPMLIFVGLGKLGVLDRIPAEAVGRHRVIYGVLTLASIIVGYVLMVRFTRLMERRGERYRTELDVAARMHATIVPPIEVSTRGLEIFGRSEASTEMGGDLIDVIVEGDRTDLYLADVSGHGVRAGVLMAMVKSAIRTRLLDGVPLASVMTGLNQVVVQVKEPPMFVTFAALRFVGSASVEYALAGHLPVMQVRGDGRVDELVAESLPLGVEEQEGFVPRTVPCERGDLFVVYTDGLIEVMNGKGQQMGMDVFRGLVAANAKRALPEIYESIMGAVRAHGQQADDQTLLLARVR